MKTIKFETKTDILEITKHISGEFAVILNLYSRSEGTEYGESIELDWDDTKELVKELQLILDIIKPN